MYQFIPIALTQATKNTLSPIRQITYLNIELSVKFNTEYIHKTGTFSNQALYLKLSLNMTNLRPLYNW